jgi:predicted ATPase
MSAPRWRLRLLGAFELDADGVHHTRLPTRAVTLLLASLAMGAGREHAREVLIERLWPGVDWGVGRNRLRQALSVLKSVLEPDAASQGQVLSADRHSLRLLDGALWCDVPAFQAALKVGDAPAAQALYRGELLPGLYEDWVLEARRHLAAQLFGAGGAKRALRQPTAAGLPLYLTRLWGFESAAASLKAALQTQRLVVLRGPGGAGKTRLAVEVARLFCSANAAEEGWAFDLVCYAPLAACTTCAHLHDAVLLALRQDGDSGGLDAVTRITQALAGRRVLLLLDNFEQLVEVGRSDVAAWLSQLPSLHILVTSRRALALDGEFEQALAPLPAVVPGGSLQDHALHPAVALFVARAAAVQAGFALSLRNHELVADIVHSLGGLPLAIELAAARLRSLPLSDLHQMLQARGEPGQALNLLARSGPRGADDPRHASMLQVVQWSWRMLTGPQQQALVLLAHCDGGAELSAVAHMLAADGQGDADSNTGATLAPDLGRAAEVLDALVAASVVYTQPQVHDDNHWRYLPFEPVREFALMVAGPKRSAHARAAHRAWMAAWATTTAVARVDSRAPAPRPLQAFRSELPNVALALASAVADGVPQQAVALVVACDTALMDINLQASTVNLLLQALRAAPPPAPALAWLIAAELAFKAGVREAVMPNVEKALTLTLTPTQRAPSDPLHLGADAQRLRARVAGRAGLLLLRVPNDMPRAQALFEEARALARAHADASSEIVALRGLAILAVRRDHDMQRNLLLHQQCLALAKTDASAPRQAEVMVALAIALGYLHRPLEQLPVLAQVQQICQTTGQRRLWAFASSVTGYVLADLRRFDDAAASYRACLEMAWHDSAWREWFYPLWNLPRTLAHQRRPEAAAQMMGFAEHFYAQRFGTQGWEDTREARRTRRLVLVQLGRSATDAAWAAGRALNMAQAMQLALRETEAQAVFGAGADHPVAG